MQVFEGPWPAAFERRARSEWKIFNCPIDKMTAAGVSAVAATYKAEAMQQQSAFMNAPSPVADSREWEAWLTSPQGPRKSGKIPVSFDMLLPETQLQKLRFYWPKKSAAYSAAD
jgi:hypothetical protein